MLMVKIADAVDERPTVTVPVARVAATIAGWYGSSASLARDLPRLAELQDAIVERDELLARDMATVLGAQVEVVESD